MEAAQLQIDWKEFWRTFVDNVSVQSCIERIQVLRNLASALMTDIPADTLEGLTEEQITACGISAERDCLDLEIRKQYEKRVKRIFDFRREAKKAAIAVLPIEQQRTPTSEEQVRLDEIASHPWVPGGHEQGSILIVPEVVDHANQQISPSFALQTFWNLLQDNSEMGILLSLATVHFDRMISDLSSEGLPWTDQYSEMSGHLVRGLDELLSHISFMQEECGGMTRDALDLMLETLEPRGMKVKE